MTKFRKKIFSASPKMSAGNLAVNGLLVGLPAYGMIQTHKEGKEAEKQGKATIEEMDKVTKAMNARTRELSRQYEKSFGIPVALASGALMVGTTGAQMIQSSNQMKKQEKMNGKQIAAQDRQTRAVQKQNELLNKIAEKNSPDTAQKAAEVLLPPDQQAIEQQKKKKKESEFLFSQRNYASLNPNWAKLRVAGRDLGKACKAAGINSFIKGTIKGAAGITAAGYLVNKIIQRDMKKNNLGVDNSGNLVQQNSQQRAYSVLGKALGPAITFSFEAPRLLSYQAEKKQLKNQIAATSQPNPKLKKPLKPGQGQKQFSILSGIGSTIKSIPQKTKSGWQTFNSHRGRTLSGGAMKIGSFGSFGTKNVQNFGKSLGNSNISSLSKAGNWIKNHPTKANIVALAPAIGIGSVLYTKAMNTMRKGMEKIDPDAYKYQNSKEKAVQPKQGGNEINN